MKIAVIDNFDSFTYNLVQYLSVIKGTRVRVIRSNENESAIEDFRPDKILVSPGPGKPEHSGLSLKAIDLFHKSIPILGVCLGHQAIALYFGGRVVKSKEPVHGKTSPVIHSGKGVFHGLPCGLPVMRYHSLTVEKDSLPPDLEITAWTEDKEIMALRHRKYDVEGVQFHPESVLTHFGNQMIENWVTGYS